jgi:hypothetical protein
MTVPPTDAKDGHVCTPGGVGGVGGGLGGCGGLGGGGDGGGLGGGGEVSAKATLPAHV